MPPHKFTFLSVESGNERLLKGQGSAATGLDTSAGLSRAFRVRGWNGPLWDMWRGVRDGTWAEEEDMKQSIQSCWGELKTE